MGHSISETSHPSSPRASLLRKCHLDGASRYPSVARCRLAAWAKLLLDRESGVLTTIRTEEKYSLITAEILKRPSMHPLRRWVLSEMTSL